MRKRLILISLLTVFVLLAGWILGTGLVKVEPQTVRVVRVWEPGSKYAVAKPFINDSNSLKFYLTWPRIPGTDIGVREETYSLNVPLVINTKIELFSVGELTGNPDDANKIAYLVVSGNAQITDWRKFILALDPKASPENQGKSRVELLAQEFQLDLYLPFLYFLDSHFADFCSRVYFAHKFAEEFDLTSSEEIEEFFKTHRTWYWVFGPTYLKQLQEQIKRNVFPPLSIAELAFRCYLADEIERSINYANQEISGIEEQKQALCEGFNEATLQKAESVFSQFLSYLKTKGEEFPFVFDLEKELSDYLVRNQIAGITYSPQEIYVIRTLVNLEAEKLLLADWKNRLEKIALEILQPFFKSFIEYTDEKEFIFWQAAIQEAVKNKELLFDILVADFYNHWLKTSDSLSYFKEYWEHSLLPLLTERDVGVKLDLSFEIEEINVKEAPTK